MTSVTNRSVKLHNDILWDVVILSDCHLWIMYMCIMHVGYLVVFYSSFMLCILWFEIYVFQVRSVNFKDLTESKSTFKLRINSDTIPLTLDQYV